MNAQPAQPVSGEPISPVPLPPSHHMIVEAAVIHYRRWREMASEREAIDRAIAFILRAERASCGGVS